jgi:hypothetical protein
MKSDESKILLKKSNITAHLSLATSPEPERYGAHQPERAALRRSALTMVKQLHFERPGNWDEKSRQVASSGLLARMVTPSLENAARSVPATAE